MPNKGAHLVTMHGKEDFGYSSEEKPRLNCTIEMNGGRPKSHSLKRSRTSSHFKSVHDGAHLKEDIAIFLREVCHREDMDNYPHLHL